MARANKTGKADPPKKKVGKGRPPKIAKKKEPKSGAKMTQR